MPASRRGERLTDRFGQVLAAESRAAATAAAAAAGLIVADPDQTAPAMSRALRRGQTRAVILVRRFLLAYIAAEDPARVFDPTGTPAELDPVARAVTPIVGHARRGLDAGIPAEAVVARAAMRARRAGQDVTQTAARLDMARNLAASPHTSGWRWRTRGDNCLACLARDNGRIRPAGSMLNGHPGCDCIAEPVVAGTAAKLLHRPTGADVLANMGTDEQDRRYGAKAAAIRSGDASLADFVHVDRVAGRPVIVEGPVPAARART